VKTKMPKRDDLTAYQGAIWEAVKSSPHGLATICNRSGYSYQSFKNWMNGVYEPSEVTFIDVMKAIASLEGKPPKSINWDMKKGELVNLKAAGMSNRAIAKKMNTTLIAIQRASKRLLKAA
jgi:hypothetical protein